MALLDSIWANAHEVTQALIEAGARTDVKRTDGKGLHHAAEMYADVRMCEILNHADIAGLDPYAKMEDGMTAWEKLRARIGPDLMTGVEPGGAKTRSKDKYKDGELIEVFGALALSTEKGWSRGKERHEKARWWRGWTEQENKMRLKPLAWQR
jgi:hypothetical protein